MAVSSYARPEEEVITRVGRAMKFEKLVRRQEFDAYWVWCEIFHFLPLIERRRVFCRGIGTSKRRNWSIEPLMKKIGEWKSRWKLIFQCEGMETEKKTVKLIFLTFILLYAERKKSKTEGGISDFLTLVFIAHPVDVYRWWMRQTNSVQGHNLWWLFRERWWVWIFLAKKITALASTFFGDMTGTLSAAISSIFELASSSWAVQRTGGIKDYGSLRVWQATFSSTMVICNA